MSKLGKKPQTIPNEVKVVVDGRNFTAVGPLGESSLVVPDLLTVSVDQNTYKVSRTGESKQAKSLHGTYVRLLNNLITGAMSGFTKTLEVVGTGFKAEIQDNTLILSLGYSHQIKYPIPDDVKIQVLDNKISVTGISRERVGLVTHNIKSFRQPDSYKGKGLRYEGQKLKLKPGKAAAKGTVK